MVEVMPKRELITTMQRFIADKDRGISMELFCELCGLSETHFKKTFIYEALPLSETIQRRVSRGYRSWYEGRVAVMQNRDNSKFVEYRRQPIMRMKRSTGLQVVNGEIKIKLGITNRADYSNPTLDEMLQRS